MGVVIVSADWSNPEAVQVFQHTLAQNQPAFMLGIVLPPDGEVALI